MMGDTSFADAYPHLTRWITTYGWIEIGGDDYRRSFVRVLDSGGMVWEGGEIDTPLDAVVADSRYGTDRHPPRDRSVMCGND